MAHETVLKESDSKDKGFRLESPIKPRELYMNTNSILINKNSSKTGLKISLCQDKFISA